MGHRAQSHLSPHQLAQKVANDLPMAVKGVLTGSSLLHSKEDTRGILRLGVTGSYIRNKGGLWQSVSLTCARAYDFEVDLLGGHAPRYYLEGQKK
jgi:hypothetical protein